MSVRLGIAAVLALGASLAQAEPSKQPRAASLAEWRAQCAGKSGWSDPAPPLHVFANVYNVGTCDVVVLLITSPKGHVLLDGATAEAAPSIAANIERLGFKLRDIRIIGGSHEHLDHAGGIAELQRRSGAVMVARAPGRGAYESGGVDPTDPQAGLHPLYPAVRVGRIVRDGEQVRVGALRLTAHATPGHSPGSTSWSWRSCEGRRCVNFVYADSISAISRDGYRFSDHPAYVLAFRTSLDRIGSLPCDILVTPHQGVSKLIERLAGGAPLIDPQGCKAYAEQGRRGLEARLSREGSSPQ